MLQGKSKWTKILPVLFVTGSVLLVGQAGAVTGSTQKKHERTIASVGVGGPTEKGNGTRTAARSTATNKRPCHAHEGTAKRKCIKVYRENQRRANMKWPPRPTVKEIQDRIGMNQWRKAERVAVCETGGNWNHYPNGSYIGGLGMYRQTYGYGQRATGYRWVAEGATKQEQIAIAIASFPITYGWSGWGCGGA